MMFDAKWDRHDFVLLPPFANMSWMALMRKQNFWKVRRWRCDTKVSKRMNKKRSVKKERKRLWRSPNNQKCRKWRDKATASVNCKGKNFHFFVALFWAVGPWPGRKAKWMSNIMYSWLNAVPADVRKKLVFHTSNMMIIRVECVGEVRLSKNCEEKKHCREPPSKPTYRTWKKTGEIVRQCRD